MPDRPAGDKAGRRADQAMVATHHEARLADPLEHVRAGFGEYDAGRIDPFELDDIIHQYKRATIELRKLCAVSGVQLEFVARSLHKQLKALRRLGWTVSALAGELGPQPDHRLQGAREPWSAPRRSR